MQGSTLWVYIIKAYPTEVEASFWHVYLSFCFGGFSGMNFFHFCSKMLFSALYFISAIFAEVPQCGIILTLPFFNVYTLKCLKAVSNNFWLILLLVCSLVCFKYCHVPYTLQKCYLSLYMYRHNLKHTAYWTIGNFPLGNKVALLSVITKTHRGKLSARLKENGQQASQIYIKKTMFPITGPCHSPNRCLTDLWPQLPVLPISINLYFNIAQKWNDFLKDVRYFWYQILLKFCITDIA